jgi:hypothetical protein
MLRAAVEEELRSRSAVAGAVDAAFRDWHGDLWLDDRERS